MMAFSSQDLGKKREEEERKRALCSWGIKLGVSVLVS